MNHAGIISTYLIFGFFGPLFGLNHSLFKLRKLQVKYRKYLKIMIHSSNEFEMFCSLISNISQDILTAARHRRLPSELFCSLLMRKLFFIVSSNQRFTHVSTSKNNQMCLGYKFAAISLNIEYVSDDGKYFLYFKCKIDRIGQCCARTTDDFTCCKQRIYV